jgi:hypothetical protein
VSDVDFHVGLADAEPERESIPVSDIADALGYLTDAYGKACQRGRSEDCKALLALMKPLAQSLGLPVYTVNVP